MNENCEHEDGEPCHCHEDGYSGRKPDTKPDTKLDIYKTNDKIINMVNWQLRYLSGNVKSISKNRPCPCGSGKLYKRCCQKEVEILLKENINEV